ncbi:hypothetical protein KZ820_19340 [Sphingomonas sp. RRHST34]|uniref:Uncharacterized protein n=1 Tax=Sphingomonas citri TaxID=2862499 RepID=A0ABS7BTH6_9SPHN|nr:hypothetical protein [Sphingomonas citri]MBW6532903.1 hypothetical protein [Sphingomonas citri]
MRWIASAGMRAISARLETRRPLRSVTGPSSPRPPLLAVCAPMAPSSASTSSAPNALMSAARKTRSGRTSATIDPRARPPATTISSSLPAVSAAEASSAVEGACAIAPPAAIVVHSPTANPFFALTVTPRVRLVGGG